MPDPLELRLSLAFAGGRMRALLESLYAIDAEIAATVRPGVEHSVAHAKLGWWRGETDRLAAGRPEHPLTHALYRLAGAAPRYGLLHERLAAADFALVGFAPATAAELELLVERSHGALQSLAAEALAGAALPPLADFGRALGCGLGLVEALEPGGAALIATLPRAPLLERARDSLTDARQRLPAALRPAQAHGLVRGALAERRLARLAGRLAAPAPLSQLLDAWRAARRARLE
jgi:hypothetical protein